MVESEATAAITIGSSSKHEVALGNGPVNAIDKAIRKALIQVYPSLSNVELIDFKVRILEPHEGKKGTGAVTRVLIEFRDEHDLIWRTVGVSTNIIDASVMALSDGIVWKLLNDGAKDASLSSS